MSSLWNARSLVNKLNHFQSFVYCHDFQIVAITESWLKPYILDNEILPTGYNIFRNDRSSRGGGVMLAVKDTITSKLIAKHNSLEAIIVSVLCNKKDITICLLYVPPDSNQSHHETLLEFMSTLSCHDHLLILGDVNLPDVDWENYQGQTDFSSQFCDKIFELNLEQLVNKPTHINGNILDVVLTNFLINQPTCSI